MRLAPTVFVSGAADAGGLLRSLRKAGFTVGDSARVTFTVLDTLDGRLHRRGLRLVATRTDTVTVGLTDPSAAHGLVTTGSLPIRANDLPGGSVRDTVIAATGERLLLAQTTVVARRTVATRRTSSGELQALVTVDHKLHLAGRRSPLASTVTVHRVAGKGKARRSVEALCAEVAFAPSSGDVLSEVLDTAGVDLGAVPRSPAEEFGDATTALEGVRAVLARLFVAVDGYWNGAVDSRDPAFVHGLRVASRRSRSVLVEGKTVLPREALSTAGAGLGLVGACTGPARDLDVYLAEWDGYMSSFAAETVAALNPVKALLEARRRDAYGEVAVALRSPAMRTFVRDWGRWLRKPVSSGSLTRRPDSARDLTEFVVDRIERAHQTLLAQGRLITDDSPATQLHDLRRDAQRLRYLLECFSALLPAKATKQFVRRLKSLQDNLGAHQDAEVHAAQLAVLVSDHDSNGLTEETVAATGLLISRLEQQCHAARTEFSTRFADYDSPATQEALIRILAVHPAPLRPSLTAPFKEQPSIL